MIHLYHETENCIGSGTLTKWESLGDLPDDIRGRSKISLGHIVHTGPSINNRPAPVAFATTDRSEMDQFLASHGIVALEY